MRVIGHSRGVLCPVCGDNHLTIHVDDCRFRMLNGVEVPYSATYSKCVRCGEEFFNIDQSHRASKAAADAVRAYQERPL